MNKVKRACFIGQPNVGKSTLFNYLTKSNQHTGNWTGKTVDLTTGTFILNDVLWEVVDLPGTYSLIGESEEEKITSNYVYKNDYDVAIVVIDATNLERSITLLLEVLEVTKNVILCLNLIDEAKKRNIVIHHEILREILNIPVILMSVKEEVGITEFYEQLKQEPTKAKSSIEYSSKITHYLDFITPYLEEVENKQAIALKLLIDDLPFSLYPTLSTEKLKKYLHFFRSYISKKEIKECFNLKAEEISLKVVDRHNEIRKKSDVILDFLLTNKWTGIPLMILLLFIILWLTISLSNIPSDWLFKFFNYLEPKLYQFLSFLPTVIVDPLIYGGYRTLYWVVSVMTPPMLIFFPLFSLLEEYGLLPRIAFNLDRPFQKCGSCGKQSLTMCMGLGCNAVGVTATRIMENKKMRILAILTNVFMPCNGRFPAMITMISMFFVISKGISSSLLASIILTIFIIFGIFLTFLMTWLCNHFLFKEEKSVFVLELPAFRKPKIVKTIYHAIKDKALDVLKRAMKVAFPAGLLIYFLANININEVSIFQYLQQFLDPVGIALGLDGVIILAFLLGIPANEIVIPIMLLGYSKGNFLVPYETLETLKQILISNNWTILTALNFLLMSLCHFPCATTLLTIKEETKSNFYTLLAFILPTLVGIILCLITTLIFR